MYYRQSVSKRLSIILLLLCALAMKSIVSYATCKQSMHIHSSASYNAFRFLSHLYATTRSSTCSSSKAHPNDVYKLPRIYMPNNELTTGKFINLDEKESHYILNVMRMKQGSRIRVFNSRYGEYVASIDRVAKSKISIATIEIAQQIRSTATPTDIGTATAAGSVASLFNAVVLYFSPIKRNRMKVLLEKVTELGVGELVQVVTQNTNEKDSINTVNSQVLLVESAEQCERLTIPLLRDAPINLPDLIKSLTCGGVHADVDSVDVLYVCRERHDGGVPLLVALQNKYNSVDTTGRFSIKIGLLVGPEGGFTREEFAQLEKCQDKVQFVTLGDTVLRSETSCICALSVISQYLDSIAYK